MPLNSEIAQLILEKGRALGQGALGSGQAWGSALSQIGQDVENLPKVIEQSKRDADQQRARDAQRTLSEALKPEAVPPVNQDGLKLYNVKGIGDYMAAKGFGAEFVPAAQHLDTVNQSMQQFQQARIGVIKAGATALAQSGAPPDLTDDFLEHLKGNQVYDSATIQKWQDTIKDDPSKAMAIVSYLAGPQKMETVPADASVINPLQPSKPVFTAPSKPGEGQHVVNGQIVDAQGNRVGSAVPMQARPLPPEEVALKEAQIKEIDAKLNGTVPMSEKDRAELGIQRGHLAAQVAHWNTQDAANEAAPSLTPDAIKLTARQFAMTGQLPPMGMGKSGAKVRTDIINAAADEYKNLDLPSQIAAYKSNQHSLTNVTGTLDTLTAFENTAGKNLKQFVDLAAKIPDTGVPWLNMPVRVISDKMLGSADMKAAKAAGDVALREIARVTNDPKLSGVLSDDARKAVNGLASSADATLPQILAVAKVLQNDMANVHGSLSDQKKAIEQRIATPPGEAAKEPAAATPSSSVPDKVAAALKGASPGIHTLSDGSTWTVNRDGSVTKGS